MIGKNKLSLQKPSKIILGIDPGTLFMGYGIIEISSNCISLKEMNVLRLSGKKNNYERLQLIHEKVLLLLKTYHPNEFAIEAPFFGKNVQSMLKLGRAQGVAIAAAMTTGIPVTEYSPKKVKQSITGNGNADKDQVWRMLQQILQLVEKPKSYDATDALAVAICHHFQSGNIVRANQKSTIVNSKPTKGWDDFVKKNPARVR
ncbi:MAG TPA: crossover junction endodeoxyribonuclease RuvC [Chitinophagaceae bacterium]